MKIEIGDKNKIKHSNVGANNTISSNKNSILCKIVIGAIVAFISGVVLLFLEYKLGIFR